MEPTNQDTTPVTVALVLIGNELLSGKIPDQNGAYTIQKLRELGAQLIRVVVIPDDQAAIVQEVRRCIREADFVVTSGGVGPTHDDITLECVAEAIGVPTEQNPRLADMIRSFFDAKTTPEHLRMAQIPQGATLVETNTSTWPVIKAGSVFVLPGVPEIFKKKLDAIADTFKRGHWYLRSVYLDEDEGSLAGLLTTLEATFDVAIGSYPQFKAQDYRVRVTIEARHCEPVNQAIDTLLDAMTPERVIRVDPKV